MICPRVLYLQSAVLRLSDNYLSGKFKEVNLINNFFCIRIYLAIAIPQIKKKVKS